MIGTLGRLSIAVFRSWFNDAVLFEAKLGTNTISYLYGLSERRILERLRRCGYDVGAISRCNAQEIQYLHEGRPIEPYERTRRFYLCAGERYVKIGMSIDEPRLVKRLDEAALNVGLPLVLVATWVGERKSVSGVEALIKREFWRAARKGTEYFAIDALPEICQRVIEEACEHGWAYRPYRLRFTLV